MRFGLLAVPLSVGVFYVSACTVNLERFTQEEGSTSSSTSSSSSTTGTAGGQGGTGGEGGAATSVPASCEAAEAGAGMDCGANQDQDCCGSILVSDSDGMSYFRAADYCQTSDPMDLLATVSPFRLDTFEVTVGRFRQFLAAYPLFTAMVEPGFGARPTLADSGWPAAASLPTLPDDLVCNTNRTWTPEPTADSERKPINCVSWEAAFLFCLWDGGYLPTEAEWNYAAAGGFRSFRYPWGDGSPTDGMHAVYRCSDDNQDGFSDAFPTEPCPEDALGPEAVGGKPDGRGHWGHFDLAGNVAEWTMDLTAVAGTGSPDCDLPTPCNDCARLTGATFERRIHRGGGWDNDYSIRADVRRTAVQANARTGFRCMRLP